MTSEYLNPLDLASVSKCKLCPLLGKDHVPSAGSPDAEVMVIGQSPGKNEVEEAQPFVGECGEAVNMFLFRAGVDREDVYIANALKCRPPNNRAGHPIELNKCYRTWLFHEIQIVNPKVVVVLGKDAFSVLLPKSVDFGDGITVKSKKRTYLVLYHPGYWLRQMRPDKFAMHGELLKKLLTDGPNTSSEN